MASAISSNVVLRGLVLPCSILAIPGLDSPDASASSPWLRLACSLANRTRCRSSKTGMAPGGYIRYSSVILSLYGFGNSQRLNDFHCTPCNNCEWRPPGQGAAIAQDLPHNYECLVWALNLATSSSSWDLSWSCPASTSCFTCSSNLSSTFLSFVSIAT